MTINKTVKKEKVLGYAESAGAHRNFMDGISFNVRNPLVRLYAVASSSFFGEPSYYKGCSPKRKLMSIGRFLSPSLNDYDRRHLHCMLESYDPQYKWRKLTPAQTIERCIDEALDEDPITTLQIAIDLRNRDNIRVTPQVILVRAANHRKVRGGLPGSKNTQPSMIAEAAEKIILRMDEPATGLAYQLHAFGRPIPNSLKKAWARKLKSANSYQLAKYRMDNRVVKTVDAANLAYGKGFYGHKGPIGDLMRDELRLGGDNKTWESMRSDGASWEDCIPVMGHMALLRNIRNFEQDKVSHHWLDKFINGARTGRQLPFRYYTAYNELRNIASPFVLDAIEQAMMLSLEVQEPIPGKSLVLSDNSGSAWGCPISEMSTVAVAQIGNLMGIMTAQLSDEGWVGVFGDRLEMMTIRKRSSIFDMEDKLNDMGQRVGGGTENGIWLAFEKALNDHTFYDNIFVYSDMQAGHGGLYGIPGNGMPSEYSWKSRGRKYVDVAKLVNIYRAEVNPQVNVFLVQIAGYEDTLLPEYYERTYIMGGWSGYILKFAAKMASLNNL